MTSHILSGLPVPSCTEALDVVDLRELVLDTSWRPTKVINHLPRGRIVQSAERRGLSRLEKRLTGSWKATRCSVGENTSFPGTQREERIIKNGSDNQEQPQFLEEARIIRGFPNS